MRERPILFSDPMVRAILDGTKTQTRRVVKHKIIGPNPPTGIFDWHHPRTDEWMGAHGGGIKFGLTNAARLCPYGQPGDRLWVREAWRTSPDANAIPPRDLHDSCVITYEADDGAIAGWGKYRPGMFMPRWASRITLEIVGVRVERLQDISDSDAFAEGVEKTSYGCHKHAPGGHGCMTGRDGYRELWESINGPGSWDANPFVWVVEFKRIEVPA